MFTLYSAANSEILLTQLIEILKNQPLKTVFAQENFLVANQGVERWLCQRLADEFSVFANYQISLPEAFFRQLSRNIDSRLDNPQFSEESLCWRIESLLRDSTEEVFQPLINYLHADNAPIKRYQLAQQLAQLFHAYQQFRPKLLTAWQHGQLQTQHPAEAWQQALWQKITAQIGNEHQGQLWQQAIDKLQQTATGTLRYQLPTRLFVFGLSSLSPLQLQYLRALAKHCEVYFYWLNPSALNQPNLHPLLASLGQQGREFQALLFNAGLLDLSGFKNLTGLSAPIPNNNLQQLQHDLINASIHATALSLATDDSISIHSCHSRMREVEVLKNQLLATLEKNQQIELRNIVVVAPNIQSYAPFIAAVFSDIPHAIVGRVLQQNSLMEAFIQFLKLCDSRFGWQSVLDLLEQATVYPSFDLTETDLELIKQWLSDTHVRWGKSAEHKQQLNLPPLSENTWQHSLERLLMGYAVGSDDDFVDQVLPYKHIEGSAAQALGGLHDFIKLLFQASSELTQAKTLSAWGAAFHAYADLLFASLTVSERQPLNEIIAEFSAHASSVNPQPITLQVMIAHIESTCAAQKSASGLLRGQLTFCSMTAVRGIPFAVIAVLGMNESDFPRKDKHTTFDLMAQTKKIGDPSPRAEDRQQFLELLCAAQQQLILTYIGQSLAQNQTIPPSVVISELLEVLEFDYQLKNQLIKHPLQPFSARYFTNVDQRLFSYVKADCETAQALAAVKPEAKVWWQGSVPTSENDFIELSDLFSFYRHPQRYFLRRQLDLRFQGITADAPEREPFVIEGLENYSITHEWIDALLNGDEFTVEKLQARGVWLSGVMGELEFARQHQQIAEFVQQIIGLNLGKKQEDVAIDLTVSNYRLMGKLSNRYQQGSLFYRFATLKGKDFLIALLQHCVMNHRQPQTTYLLSVDKLLIFPPELSHSLLLERLIELYVAGQQRPNALFTDSVLDYVRQAYVLKISSRANKAALEVAQEKLRLALQQEYEPELRRLYSAAEDLTELLNDEFVDFCEQVILPVWEALHL